MLYQRGRAYSQDLRERVLASEDAGLRVGQIAQRFQVSISYVSKVLSRRRLTGETRARPQRGHLPLKLAAQHEAIRAQVTAVPDATLAELRAWLKQTHQVSASEGLMCQTLARLGLAHKKSRYAPPNRTAPMWPRRAPNGGRCSLA
jgi:transposase